MKTLGFRLAEARKNFGLTQKQVAEYIKETQEYIHPLMGKARNEYPQYSNQLFLIRYHMNSVLEAMRHHMRSYVDATI